MFETGAAAINTFTSINSAVVCSKLDRLPQLSLNGQTLANRMKLQLSTLDACRRAFVATKRSNLKLKTRHKQLSGSLPLASVLPERWLKLRV